MSGRDLLNPELLLAAYAQGLFPMADPPVAGRRRPIRLYQADPRAIIPLEPMGLHVPRTVERDLRRGRFTLTSDRAFRAVMTACAEVWPERGGPEGSWISPEMIDLYTAVHEAGFAHSIEAWREREGQQLLVGGIYGVSIGAAFFAESMFCRPGLGGSGASSVCLVTLARHLHTNGYLLLDVQLANPHTSRFGVVEMRAPAFSSLLRAAVCRPDAWRPWTPSRITPDSGRTESGPSRP